MTLVLGNHHRGLHLPVLGEVRHSEFVRTGVNKCVTGFEMLDNVLGLGHDVVTGTHIEHHVKLLNSGITGILELDNRNHNTVHAKAAGSRGLVFRINDSVDRHIRQTRHEIDIIDTGVNTVHLMGHREPQAGHFINRVKHREMVKPLGSTVGLAKFVNSLVVLARASLHAHLEVSVSSTREVLVEVQLGRIDTVIVHVDTPAGQGGPLVLVASTVHTIYRGVTTVFFQGGTSGGMVVRGTAARVCTVVLGSTRTLRPNVVVRIG